jgi:hypothetical protein
MKVKGLLVGSALLALLGGCATYDDGGYYGYYGDGRVYSYDNNGYYNNGYYRYNDRWHRWDGDRYYGDRYYRTPDYSFGFSYNQH